ncbi:hypothetical protein FGO68_gene1504 [Halteria grandinella]|uniref:Uncharacterized protein n=1 Tax=Halteria grandinella TaxID=5974 RepID=A0A8J8NEU6_HALGN|nr:hypothetical protein FGO68_gene1504 [Halteria grandinella]
MIKKEESGSAPALGFMKPIEKKTRDASVLKQLGNASTSPKALKVPQGFQLAPIVLENQKDPFIKPKLSVDLKLEVIKLQQEKQPIEKQHIQDTAEVLEEILQASEQGLLSLPERQKIQAKEEHKNKALEDKEAKAKYDRMLEKQREEIRKKRHLALQEEIEKKKQEKIKQEEEQKLQKEAAEKEKKVKQKRDVSQAKTKDDQKRQLIDEAKRKKEEEKAQKKAEEEERKLIEKLRKQQDNKEFFKKQKQQLEQEFVKRRMEQEEAEKIKKEMEDIKKAQQEQVKNKMVNFMKQNKDHQRNEQQEWEQIQAFLNEPETQAVFNKYEKSFGKTFKHFAALDKKDMNLHSLQRISLQEFTKFGFQLKLIPRVATNEDFIHIFRALIREKTSTLTQKELDELGLGVNTLGLEDFKKAMIRIAILGQNRLPEDEWLLYKLPEWMAEGTSAGHKSVPQSTTNRVQKNIKIRGRSTLNSQGSQRRLIKQGSTAGIENEEGPGAGEISQTDINPIAAKKASVVRKTKEQKLIEELGKAKERQEKLGNIKIEDRKLNKAFDVSLVNSHTIDALLQYLQLQPNAHVDHHDKTNLVEGIPVPEGAAEEQINEFDPYNEGGVYDENGNPIEGDGQQAAQSHNDKEELERQGYDDNIVGPDGEKEQWKMVE